MQSIGERLEEARKRKGISIREAAEATKIRSDYLHKFESNQFDIKLPEIYVRGFLRTYANYLKTPADKIVGDYNALGLGEAKHPRALNREVYGRMDLSISSAKNEKENQETTPPVETTPPHEPAPARNPATFVPKPSSGGLPIDRALLIKGGALAAVVIVLVVVLIVVLTNRGEKSGAGVNVPPSTAAVWVHPQAGDHVLTLIAIDRVQVTAQEEPNGQIGQILFQDSLPRGDRRDIPYRTAIRLRTDNPANLQFSIDGSAPWPVQDPNTKALLSNALIKGPSR